MTEKKHRYNKDFHKIPDKKEETDVNETPVKEEKKTKAIKKMVNTNSTAFLNVRSEPKIGNNIIGKLYNGNIVTVKETVDDTWTKIDKGYVMTKFLTDKK